MSDAFRRTRRLDALRGLHENREAPEPVESRPRLSLVGWSQRDELLYARRVELPGQAARVLPRELLEGTPEEGAAADLDELIFFDTETTGLSGGSGTLVFLVGMAWCEGPHLEIEQLFLADYPGEPAFLEAVRERFADRRLAVSFNGRTFDTPLLRTRFTQNRMPFEIGPQLDLLHASRRLWRSITRDCSLKTLEERILGVTREVDIAGEEIPLVYFSWLNTGRPGLLPAVFEHNLVDVTSLPRLYDDIGRLYGGEEVDLPVDGRALGSWLLDRGRIVGANVLSRAFDHGDLEAGFRLALHFKRGGRWEEAVAVWETLVRDGRSLHAAVELAKYHEHHRHDPSAALERVEVVLSWNLPLDARTREALLRRKRRLESRRQRREAIPRSPAP